MMLVIVVVMVMMPIETMLMFCPDKASSFKYMSWWSFTINKLMAVSFSAPPKLIIIFVAMYNLWQK